MINIEKRRHQFSQEQRTENIFTRVRSIYSALLHLTLDTNLTLRLSFSPDVLPLFAANATHCPIKRGTRCSTIGLALRPWKPDPETNIAPLVVYIQKYVQASKLTVSQVEIGFDILKARDIVPGEIDGAGSAVQAAVTPPSSKTTVATSSRSSEANPSCENTAPAAATTKTAKAGAAACAALSSGDGGNNNEEVEIVDDRRKRYRLMVKRRLLKRHGEELSTDASTRKRQLEELYRDVEADLLRSGAKLRK